MHVIKNNVSLFLFSLVFFFFNDTATTEIYTLSLHDALPISPACCTGRRRPSASCDEPHRARSEEHTSELQSRSDLVCRLLLEKKKKQLYPLLLHKKKNQNKRKEERTHRKE